MSETPAVTASTTTRTNWRSLALAGLAAALLVVAVLLFGQAASLRAAATSSSSAVAAAITAGQSFDVAVGLLQSAIVAAVVAVAAWR